MVHKAESNNQAIVAGVTTFLIAEAALLAVGKFKFEDTWALIKWTPAAAVAGGAVFVGAKQLSGGDIKSADKAGRVAGETLQSGFTVDNITVEEIDRIDALFMEACGKVADELTEVRQSQSLSGPEKEAKVAQLLSSVKIPVTDRDRVGVMCFLFRMGAEVKQVGLKRLSPVKVVAFVKAGEVSAARGWLNDRVWSGQPDSPRGKLMITVDSADNVCANIYDGCDPTLVDCEGVSGFSMLSETQLPQAQAAFISHGETERVIAWLPTLPVEQQTVELIKGAVARDCPEILAWFDANEFHDPVNEHGERAFCQAVRGGDIKLALHVIPRDEGINTKGFPNGWSAVRWIAHNYVVTAKAWNAWDEAKLKEVVEGLICHPDYDYEEALTVKQEIDAKFNRGNLAGSDRERNQAVRTVISNAVLKRRRW